MAYETVADLSANTTVTLGGTDKKTGKKNPTSVEGYYLGKRTIETKNGPATLHFFQTSKGNVGVWGKTDMNNQLGACKAGLMTHVEFTGMVGTSRGKDMYKYVTKQDKSRSIDVANLETGSGNDELDSNDYGAVNSFGAGESEDEDNNDEYEQPRLSASSSANKSKVEALLANSKRK